MRIANKKASHKVEAKEKLKEDISLLKENMKTCGEMLSEHCCFYGIIDNQEIFLGTQIYRIKKRN